MHVNQVQPTITIDSTDIISFNSNDYLVLILIIVVIITWPEKFDFVLMPEHDVSSNHT